MQKNFSEQSQVFIPQNLQQQIVSLQNCKSCKGKLNNTNQNQGQYCSYCQNKIKNLKIGAELKPLEKQFKSPDDRQTWKISMNPEFELDLIISECKVCFQKKFLIRICVDGHYFCEQCLQNYIKFYHDRSLKCIDQNCQAQVNFQLIFIYLDEKNITKWKPFLNQIPCINQNCQQEWKVLPNKLEGSVHIISQDECICEKCDQIFCYKCRTMHRQEKCNEENLLNNYIIQNKCFRCEVCNSLSQPSFCHNNYDISNLKQWNQNIYECYICKKSFCYDCQGNSQVQLYYLKYKCNHCITQYYKQKLEKVSLCKRTFFAFLLIIFIIPFSIHSTLCYGLMEVMDLVLPMLDPYFKSDNVRVKIAVTLCLPLIIAGVGILYAILLIPLFFYYGYKFYCLRYDLIENEN